MPQKVATYTTNNYNLFNPCEEFMSELLDDATPNLTCSHERSQQHLRKEITEKNSPYARSTCRLPACPIWQASILQQLSNLSPLKFYPLKGGFDHLASSTRILLQLYQVESSCANTHLRFSKFCSHVYRPSASSLAVFVLTAISIHLMYSTPKAGRCANCLWIVQVSNIISS